MNLSTIDNTYFSSNKEIPKEILPVVKAWHTAGDQKQDLLDPVSGFIPFPKNHFQIPFIYYKSFSDLTPTLVLSTCQAYLFCKHTFHNLPFSSVVFFKFLQMSPKNYIFQASSSRRKSL